MTFVVKGLATRTMRNMHYLDMLAAASDAPLDEAQLTQLNDSLGGLEETLGIRYLNVEKHSVRACLAVADQHLQPAGLVNGGVFSAIAESLAGTAGVIAAGGPVVGVNNNTDFISSVSAGVIDAEAVAVQVGRRMQVWQIDMTHRGKLAARSTVRNMVLG